MSNVVSIPVAELDEMMKTRLVLAGSLKFEQ